MRRDLTEALVIFAAALAVRLLIFYPTFIQGGDLGQFATFVREIHIYGGVPAVNTLYFPGTTFIYPPLLFSLINSINALFHPAFEPYLVMRELLVVAAVVSSVTASVIYAISHKDGKSLRNAVIGVTAVFFMPDLYALSWGGDPFVLGEMLLILSLYFLSKRSETSLGWVLFTSLTLLLLALSHDLTWFYSMFAFLILLIYDLTKKSFRIVAMEIVPFLSSLIAGLIWWVPRLRFVYDAFFVTESSGYGSYIPLSSASTYLVVFIPFAVSVVAIAFYTLYRSNVKLTKIRWDPFITALMASMIFVIFIFKSPTLGGRIMYYTIILGTIVVLRLFSKTSGPILSKMPAEKRRGYTKHLPLVILLLVVLVAIPFQAVIATGSVSHYKTGYYQYDPALLQWGESHLSNGTVVAPNIGNYISSVDGVPVIVYGNFLVGGTQIDLRNAATYIVMNPGNQTAVNYLQQYHIKYVVVTTSFMNEHSASNYFPADHYTKVFSDKYYVVEEYMGA